MKNKGEFQTKDIQKGNIIENLLKNDKAINDLINNTFSSARKKIQAIDEIYKKSFPRFKVFSIFEINSFIYEFLYRKVLIKAKDN